MRTIIAIILLFVAVIGMGYGFTRYVAFNIDDNLTAFLVVGGIISLFFSHEVSQEG